jgi:hypothetical protein
VPQECCDFLDHVVDRDPCHVRAPACGHGPHPLDDVGGPARVGDDPRQHCAQLIDIEISTPQPAQTSFGARGDGGERLIDLVSNGSREFAQDGNARRVREIDPHALDRSTRCHLFGDVDQPHKNDASLTHLRCGDDEQQHVDLASVHGQETRFALEAGGAPVAGREAVTEQLLPARTPESREGAQHRRLIPRPTQLHRCLVCFHHGQHVHRRANELGVRGEIVVDRDYAGMAQAREHVAKLR